MDESAFNYRLIVVTAIMPMIAAISIQAVSKGWRGERHPQRTCSVKMAHRHSTSLRSNAAGSALPLAAAGLPGLCCG